MCDISCLYPSVFKIIRAEAKVLNKKLRFQKEVHIRLCKKITKELEHYIYQAYQRSKGKLEIQHFETKNQKDRTKIYKTRTNGKKYADIVEMLRQDRAIIPISRIGKLTKKIVEFYHNKPYLISKKTFPIIQSFIESIILKKTIDLIHFVEMKNKSTILNTDVMDI